MANVNELTRRLEPILNDARVFSDKIARHPEVLGVRGAIAPQSGAKGVPNFAFPP
jgi:phospholipid/cholesterol/gamma-HCH transport system substrate-binding protein